MPVGNVDVPSIYEATYCGFSVLDFNFSAAAFRWIVGELLELVPFGRLDVELSVQCKHGKSQVIVGSQNGGNGTAFVILEHDLDNIWKLFPWSDDDCYFAYLVRTDPDFPYTCHVFRARSKFDAKEIIRILRLAMRKKDANKVPLDIPGDIPTDPFLKLVSHMDVPSSPHFLSSTETLIGHEKIDSFASQFEVLYLCRVEISGCSPSSSTVDEAARRYDEDYRTTQARQYVAASVKHLMDRDRRPQDDSGLRTRLRFSDDTEEQIWEHNEEQQNLSSTVRRRRRTSSLVEALVDSVFEDSCASPPMPGRKRSSIVASPAIIDLMKLRASSNRSMLMSIGRYDVSLISLVQKQKLLTRRLTEISCVIPGTKYANHFAFVCPDRIHRGRSDCFVIRCQDDSIASGAIRAMRSAFAAAFNDHVSAGGRQHVCENCPLYQYSRLCSDVDGLDPRKLHEVVVNRINQLSPCYQELIWSGYKKVVGSFICQTYRVMAETLVAAYRDFTDGRIRHFQKVWNDFNENETSSRLSPSGVLKGSQSENVQRKNIMLMSVVRSVCENAQLLHSHSVGKLFSASGNGTSAAATPMATEDEICLSAVAGASNSIELDKRAVGKRDEGETSAAPFQRFSAASRLVTLRDRARNAFGGSLDSFIKRKLSNNNNDAAGSALAQKTSVPSGDGGDKPIIVLYSEDDMDTVRRNAVVEGKTQTLSSPFTPVSPVGAMTDSQATFHFETPDRRGSDGDVRFRHRSCTVGDVFALTTSGDEKAAVTSKRVLHDKHTPMSSYRNLSDRTTNSSLVNMAAARGRRMSWRQAIFSRVVSPRLFVSRHSVAGFGPVLNDASPSSRRSSGVSNLSTPSSAYGDVEESSQPTLYRSLWKKAIMEQILTLRLESQKRLQGEEADDLRNMKLTYEEITPCSEEEVRPIWLGMLNDPKRRTTRFDRVRVEEAVKAGVPRDLRSEVWKFLLEQHQLDRSKRSQMETPPPHQYRDLLKDLTSYQHAILIDLGRTFPTHNYFSQPLGPGQLSLFNILKAYSLFDNEVGYCQGLSFVAGVLLLHMEEEDAFEMLVDMMYRLQLRRQYRPDMMALQIEMYQLSRLLHDRHKDLHDHLDNFEIPVLYAAPWFLTLFASAFPLGFVARVFDYVFLAGGLDVVFKVALILLGDHKELIKHCDSFESIHDFLKTTLPLMSIIQMERVFNQVFELDISRDLLAYEVEYHVLQEEVLSGPAGVPMTAPAGLLAKQASMPCGGGELTKLDTANKFLKRQNMELLEQLQQAHYRLAVAEKDRLELEAKLDVANGAVNSCQNKIHGLETRVETLEMERKSLLATVQRYRTALPRSGVSPGPITNGMVSTTVAQSITASSKINSAAVTEKIRNANGHHNRNSK